MEKVIERIFILDRSGSMQLCLNDTIGGYNAFINDQKSLGGTMSLYLFDNEIEKVYADLDINSVQELNNKTYIPRGNTALFDAIGTVLESINIKDDTTTSVIILTDGEENSSRKYSLGWIKCMIKNFTEKGVTFMYLGANQDAFSEANKLGIDANNTMNYNVDETQEAFNLVSTCLRARSKGVQTSLSPVPIPSRYGNSI
ncbi:MAG: VWA domain-containing protein [Bacteroidetes bacterium]|nr:VWA domain-containing protein [Bacteroidota bacterium]